MVNHMPDLEVVSKSQCFPRHRFLPPTKSSAFPAGGQPSLTPASSPPTCPTSTTLNSGNASPAGPTPNRGIFDPAHDAPLQRIDNITDNALAKFRSECGDPSITKDQIFHYAYAILHAPDYRERFANNLRSELPRLPFSPDFHAFAEAGEALAQLHLNYETGTRHPLHQHFPNGVESMTPNHYQLSTRKMKLADSGATLIVTPHVHLRGIPPKAHDYQVNGRSPIEWFIDRYHIKTDRHSGIVNDPNEWWSDPRDIISALERIVHLSVATVDIVNGLPEALKGLPP